MYVYMGNGFIFLFPFVIFLLISNHIYPPWDLSYLNSIVLVDCANLFLLRPVAWEINLIDVYKAQNQPMRRKGTSRNCNSPRVHPYYLVRALRSLYNSDSWLVMLLSLTCFEEMKHVLSPVPRPGRTRLMIKTKTAAPQLRFRPTLAIICLVMAFRLPMQPRDLFWL